MLGTTKRAGSTTTSNSQKKSRTSSSSSLSSPSTSGVLKVRPINKPYTKAELKKRDDDWDRRFKELLKAAREGDAHATLVLPDFKEYKLSMASDFKETMFKVECLDIFHYLRARLGVGQVSLSKFGPMIGVDLKKTTLQGWLKDEERLRKMGPLLPVGTKRIVKAKNSKVEKVLATWMEKQRQKALPLSRKMLCDAAEVIYTVLQDCFEFDGQDEGSTPSFSACWFTGFKKRFNISYCQLSGESGSVDMSAIEDELIEIRRICAEYSPDNIYNCDETGLYLKELNSKSYTVRGDKAGGNLSERLEFPF
jgi:hypothetical protein